MPKTIISIIHNEPAATINDRLGLNGSALNARPSLDKLQNYIDGIASGAYGANMDIQVAEGAAASASGTATSVGVLAADTLTVVGVVLTASATPSGNSQFTTVGGDTAVAASIALILNAHPVISSYVSATSAANVVTILSVQKNKNGNFLPLASSSIPRLAVSAANLSGGADAIPSFQQYHL